MESENIKRRLKKDSKKRNSHLPKLLSGAAVFSFMLCIFLIVGAFVQESNKNQFDKDVEWMKKNGKLTPATVIEKRDVMVSRSGKDSTRVKAILYLPEGKENTKENIIFENVFSDEDLNKFEQGQRIYAWIGGDKHIIQDLAASEAHRYKGVHQPLWLLILMAVLFGICGPAALVLRYKLCRKPNKETTADNE